ncbi:flagellar hook assembly protein FlgD [Roseburia sp. 499]|uniref:flagellar hook assembly protein FlgD n=1 Tax=Roseburia sp. 499 TaxID=1261634 RepID=UPI00095365B7|nr:flagellar hook capping FlgD N-terminal domain-containing protein [Roseburia sp. 499]WVK71218.1 flagellar hook capping FlgD N-terminal domain-containing protein [Roseburia sp. 499]
MAVIQQVQDGKVVDTSASSQSLSSVTKSDNSSLDKEAFLQLLVAQMKYQDPLEPTSNTEYISQLATFSSLEEMQNLNSTMETSQATNLVGKTVIMKVTSASGETTYVTGQVDYIVRENGNTYLSINDGLYSLDDLDTVVDEDYLEATNAATAFQYMVAKLPNVQRLSLSDKDKVEEVRKFYDELTDYQKQYITNNVDKAYMEKLEALEAELKSLLENANTNTDGDADTNDSNNTDGDNSGATA